jgi:hypothetical protein
MRGRQSFLVRDEGLLDLLEPHVGQRKVFLGDRRHRAALEGGLAVQVPHDGARLRQLRRDAGARGCRWALEQHRETAKRQHRLERLHVGRADMQHHKRQPVVIDHQVRQVSEST